MIKLLPHCRPTRPQQWLVPWATLSGFRVIGSRTLSLNTAINSGIRRSQGAGHFRERNRQFAGRDSQEGSRFERPDRSPRRREARPNHAGRQDVEDARESSRRAIEAPNVRQRAYLRGGRPEEPSRSYNRAGRNGEFFKERPRQDDGGSRAWPRRGQEDEKSSSFRSRREFGSPSSSRSSMPSSGGPRPRSYDDRKRSSMSSADQLHEETRRARKSGAESDRYPDSRRFESREPPRRDRDSTLQRPEHHSSESIRSSRFDRPHSRYSDDDSLTQRTSKLDLDRPSKSDRPRSRYDDNNSIQESSSSRSDSDRPLRSDRSQFRYDNDSVQSPAKLKRNDDPLSIPYTTPASEFLYGTSVVTAALKAARRKLYKLYVYEGENRERTQQDNVMIRLARGAAVPVQSLSGEGIRMMDKMSTGRPHNGYILEASPLPRTPTTALLAQSSTSESFEFAPDHQSREEAAVNGNQSMLPNTSGEDRHPLVILIDGVLDPGNLGAILRTSHFLGVSAVCIPTRTTAPLSAVALKASAGSSEFLPLLTIKDVLPFVDNCKTNGWRIYAAGAPKADASKAGKFIATTKVGNVLKEAPCLLMLGGEGEGLRGILKKKADFEVGIGGRRASEGDIESLNVSVATGLLVDSFLREEWKGKRSKAEKINKSENASQVEKVSKADEAPASEKLF